MDFGAILAASGAAGPSVVQVRSDDVSREALAERLEPEIRSRFCDLQLWPDILHLQPELLGWPTAYFCGHDLNGEDLTVHEIDGIELTSEPAKYPELIPESSENAGYTI